MKKFFNNVFMTKNQQINYKLEQKLAYKECFLACGQEKKKMLTIRLYNNADFI